MVPNTSSSSFVLELVAIWQGSFQIKAINRLSPVFQQQITGIMMELINTFEKWPKDIAMVKKEARVKIREWLRQQILIHAFMINPLHLMIMLDSVMIKVKDPDRGGRVKTVCIHLHSGMLMFEIKKKQKMPLLRTLAAEKISGFISKKDDIKELEVPRDVLDDLQEAFDDSWRVKYINTDSMKRKVSELTLDDLRKKKNCPYCGRTSFKKIINHVKKNKNNVK